MDDATPAGTGPAASDTSVGDDAATSSPVATGTVSFSAVSIDAVSSGAVSTGTASGLRSPTDLFGGADGDTAHGTAPRRRRHRTRRQRPGDLTTGWATALGSTWLLAVVALAGVWVSSRTTGLSTWWLGPEARPAAPLVTGLPFVAPLAATLATFWGVRRAPWFGIVASLATAAIGLGDLGRVTPYGIVELGIAGATLVVSVASFAGMYRAPARTAAADDGHAPTVGADAER